MRSLLFVLALAALQAEDVLPESPARVLGERIWPAPAFTHWPGVVYQDESRNASFQLPVREAGISGSIGWPGTQALPFILPTDTDQISGLVPLPRDIGSHSAEIRIGDDAWSLGLQVVDVRAAWPIAALRGGYPVTVDGNPVVLMDRRRDPATERQWSLIARSLPRSEGRPLVIGDPLAADDGDAFAAVRDRATVTVAVDAARADHAALLALASLELPLPRTLMWSPGNAPLFAASWTPEEERVLGAVRSRCEALGSLPQCVLVLPPIPVDAELQAQARERRELLQRSAVFLGWRVIDAEAIAGSAAEANRLGDRVFTRHPRAAARERLAAALADAL